MAKPLSVVKIGGSTLSRHDTTLADIAALHADGHRLVVVHGGGALISDWLAKHGLESRFVRGLRATDEAALEVVVAVLAGVVNKRLVAELQSRGAAALGLAGVDGAILRARRSDPELGFVGELVSVDAAILRGVVADGRIAVLAPIGLEVAGEAFQPQLLNVNADTVAGEVAAALRADHLVALTDVAGVLDAQGELRSRLGLDEARELLSNGTVSGGMIPKVEAAIRAAAAGVTTVIVDGREEGALRGLGAAGLGGTRIS